MQSVRLQTGVLQQTFDNRKLATGDQIPTDIVAVAGMSAGYPGAIDPSSKGVQNEFRAHAAGAGNPDNPEIGRILHSAHAGQVRRSVTAPVTQESDNFRIMILFFHTLKALSI